MAQVVLTQRFAKDAKALKMTAQEHGAIVAALSADPTIGDLIPKSGGARKVRFGRGGKGKSGGYRVVTYFGGGEMPVYALTVYTKSEKEDLDQDELRALRSLCKAILEAHRN